VSYAVESQSPKAELDDADDVAFDMDDDDDDDDTSAIDMT
jgi:hypothetical protein